MRTLRVLVLAVGLGLGLGVSARAEEKDVAGLIARLGSESFAERQEAAKALDALGPDALDALRQAARGNDPEVRRRAAELVRRIERRVETAAFLAPTKVRWTYKDAPLAEVLADVGKQTGFLFKPAEDWPAGRKVTLDTGEVPFWEAWDQLCQQAGLVESVPAPPQPKQPKGGGTSVVVANGKVIVNGVPVGGGPQDVLHPADPEPTARLVVGDGKPGSPPTHFAGAVRVRALPPGTDLPGQAKAEGEALLGLEVTAGPRLVCQRVFDVTVQWALDERGQALAPVLVFPTRPAPRANGGIVVVNGMVVSPDKPEPAGFSPRQTPLRLALGEKPAKSLRELTGTVLALVQLPPETLVTVDKVLGAAGQVVPGPGGSSVKVLEAARQDNGQVKLRLLVVPPPTKIIDGVGGPNAPAGGGGKGNFQGNLAGIGNGPGGQLGGGIDQDEVLTARNFSLADEKGGAFEAVKAVNKGSKPGEGQELELVYQPRSGQGEAARFTFTGPRAALVEVPFTLKGVPLP
jgi:hypothetical protein